MARPDVVPEWQRVHHARIDPHRRAAALSEVILGGQDGVVAVLGALLGIAAATASARLVVAAGLATAFADAVSMAGVAYTSLIAQADVYWSERDREIPARARGAGARAGGGPGDLRAQGLRGAAPRQDRRDDRG